MKVLVIDRFGACPWGSGGGCTMAAGGCFEGAEVESSCVSRPWWTNEEGCASLLGVEGSAGSLELDSSSWSSLMVDWRKVEERLGTLGCGSAADIAE